MISFAQGNLLEADVEAVVNTVNTVGIMGKGIALMFKERFPENYESYVRACRNKEVRVGKMFVTENIELFGPRWIINFPTKTHWRANTRPNWIQEGMHDLVRVINDKNIHSIAVPPLGCGNGGLDWHEVKPVIVSALQDIDDVEVIIYEPTKKYQNVSKRTGVEKLTPARALVAEIVRRYCVLGIDCSILEVQKLGWFLQRGVHRLGIQDPLQFEFSPNKYGPYSHKLTKLLNGLDGSYLCCDKRLGDASPMDLIWFNPSKVKTIDAYLNSSEGKTYSAVLSWSSEVIDGFESPLGMELLATVDWLIEEEQIAATPEDILAGIHNWPGGKEAGQRKERIFDKRLVELALEQLNKANSQPCNLI